MTQKELIKFTEEKGRSPYDRTLAAPHGYKCAICGREMTSRDKPEDWEYTKCRGGNYVFVHTECIRKPAKGGSN